MGEGSARKINHQGHQGHQERHQEENIKILSSSCPSCSSWLNLLSSVASAALKLTGSGAYGPSGSRAEPWPSFPSLWQRHKEPNLLIIAARSAGRVVRDR